MSDSEEMVREPWVFLLGVPPMEEYLSSLMQASGSDNPDLAAAAARSRTAETVFTQLTGAEGGVADGQTVNELPPSHAGRAAACQKSYSANTPGC